jgi:prepilin-type processing-associated H-X9-DG protein
MDHPAPPSPTPTAPTAAIAGQRRRRLRINGIDLLVLLLGIVSLAVSIVLPSVARYREERLWRRCPGNLRQIGYGIQLYAMEHGGRFPERIEDILATQDLTAEVFVCPYSNDSAATGPTKLAQAAQFAKGGHCSYVYVGQGLTVQTGTSDHLVVYEPMANHGNTGMYALFADGHVDWLDPDQAKRLTAAAATGKRPVVWESQGP